MKKMSLATISFLLLTLVPLSIFILHSGTVSSDVVVPAGALSGDTNWNMTGSPYWVEGDVLVPYGITLTIEPGVEVRFNGHYGIEVKGRLAAVGEQGNEITFTSNAPSPSEGDWDTILINTTGSGEIAHCDISYASCAVSVNGSADSVIRDSSIHDNLDAISITLCDDIEVWDNVINGNLGSETPGISISQSENVTVLGNNITGNAGIGIKMEQSKYCRIRNNNVSENLWHGIHLYKSTDNTVTSNVINGNHRGLVTAGSSTERTQYNDISYNIISSNRDGINITSFSEFNTITNNNMSHNIWTGLTINSGVNNHIYHNTFWSNAVQAWDNTAGNVWDRGYPDGGNFWSDYNEIDEKRGANQDVPGSDGLGDVPYFIDSDSPDYYPLMNQTRNLAPYIIHLVSPMNHSFIRAGTVIDLDILLTDPAFVNYSLDGGPETNISEPHDVNTSGWSEGPVNMTVIVVDDSGNTNSSYFLFTVDSKAPEIILNSPANNSMFSAGGIINLTIVEPHISHAQFTINNFSAQSLLFPYDIDTTGWPDDTYNISVTVEDIAGNTNSSSYMFFLDSFSPSIVLLSPGNLSFLKPGTTIVFSINDSNLASANYSVNNGPAQSFEVEYEINTTSFSQGEYTLRVSAEDAIGNTNSTFYTIIVDTITPEVILNSPDNNSVIRGGVIINFSVSDANPVVFRYSTNEVNDLLLEYPYDIDTEGWSEGAHQVVVTVTDFAGNVNVSTYTFVMDTLVPEITLAFPENNTYIPSGINISIQVFEVNIAVSRYRISGGAWEELLPDAGIDTTGWGDGVYEIEVYAEDVVGNNNSALYVFTVDETPPKITGTTPKDGQYGVDPTTSFRVRFSEPMNPDSVLYGLRIEPALNYSASWSSDNSTLIISPREDLAENAKYTVTINGTIMDSAGNHMGEDYEFAFETGEKEDWTLVILLVAAMVLLVIMLLVYRTLRKEGKPQEAEEDEFDMGEEKSPEEPGKGDKDIEDELMEDEGGESGEGQGEEEIRGEEDSNLDEETPAKDETPSHGE